MPVVSSPEGLKALPITYRVLSSWCAIPDLGSFLFTRSPKGPTRSTSTCSRFQNLFPITADMLFDYGDGNVSQSAPADDPVPADGAARLREYQVCIHRS